MLLVGTAFAGSINQKPIPKPINQDKVIADLTKQAQTKLPNQVCDTYKTIDKIIKVPMDVTVRVCDKINPVPIQKQGSTEKINPRPVPVKPICHNVVKKLQVPIHQRIPTSECNYRQLTNNEKEQIVTKQVNAQVSKMTKGLSLEARQTWLDKLINWIGGNGNLKWEVKNTKRKDLSKVIKK